MKFSSIAENALDQVSDIHELIEGLIKNETDEINFRQVSFTCYEKTRNLIDTLQPIRSELLIGSNRGALMACQAESILREAMDDLWHGWQLSQRIPFDDQVNMIYRFQRAALALLTSVSYFTPMMIFFQNEETPGEEEVLPELTKVETKYLMACYAYGSLAISDDRPVPGVRITSVRTDVSESLLRSNVVRIKEIARPDQVMAGFAKTRIEIIPGSERLCIALIEKYFGKGWPSRLANGDYNHPMKDE